MEHRTTMRKCLVSGSFSPFTNGHLEMVRQASELFDEVHVVAFCNAGKASAFVNMEAVQKSLAECGILNAVCSKERCLQADYCHKHGIRWIVRGLRDGFDYAYEEKLSKGNRMLAPDVETIYIRSKDDGLSSSMVRELMQYGKDVSLYVPKAVYETL